jgi:phosphatidylglycerophosphate synthase
MTPERDAAPGTTDLPEPPDRSWRTKPTDRFVLRWIKVHLSARITPKLVRHARLRPWMITLASAFLGVAGGVLFASGHGFSGATVAAAGQVLDGVDGQFARLTGRTSPGGAFLDSVLDRFADGALVIGTVLYLVRLPTAGPLWPLLGIGALALIGGNLISYTTARADALRLDMGRPTLASKGTRTVAIILGGWGSVIRPALPFAVLCYLAFHTNVVVIRRIFRAQRGAQG